MLKKGDDGGKICGEDLRVSEKRGSDRKKLENEIPIKPRKKPQHEIRATVMHQLIDSGILIDVSETGLRICGKTQFKPGMEIGIHFLIPDRISNSREQIPVFPICTVIWQKYIASGDQPLHTGLKIEQLPERQKNAFFAFIASLPVTGRAS